MTHYKQLRLAILLLFLSSFSYAQKIYLGISGGYGLPIASQSIAITDGSSKTDDKLVKGTYGKGINFGLNLGYLITKQISLEVGASYLKSSRIKTSDLSSSGSYQYTDEYEFSASMFRVTPALRISTSNEKVNAYARAGLVIGMFGQFERQYFSEQNGYYPNVMHERLKIISEYSGGISTGFAGSIGLTFAINENLFFFTEVNGIAQSWAPKKGKMTLYERNGVDQLSMLSVSEREAEFVNNVTETNNPSPDEPSKTFKQFIPFSAVYLNIGMQFRFGGAEKKQQTPAPAKS